MNQAAGQPPDLMQLLAFLPSGRRLALGLLRCVVALAAAVTVWRATGLDRGVERLFTASAERFVNAVEKPPEKVVQVPERAGSDVMVTQRLVGVIEVHHTLPSEIVFGMLLPAVFLAFRSLGRARESAKLAAVAVGLMFLVAYAESVGYAYYAYLVNSRPGPHRLESARTNVIFLALNYSILPGLAIGLSHLVARRGGGVAAALRARALASGRRRSTGARPKCGRNDPCPCGSGLKFKRCCGKAG